MAILARCTVVGERSVHPAMMTSSRNRRGMLLPHSPLVGPSTWHAVAERLRGLGTEAVVPDLTPVSRSEPPPHPKIAGIAASTVG